MPLYNPAAVSLTMMRGEIAGLVYSSNGADATNDLDITAGGCMDASNTDWIEIASVTKQSDVAWAADAGATPSGALDTGVVGNNAYYIWAIKNPTTRATGILFSLSPTAPTMPGGYTLKRLIGWFKRSGGAIVAFSTVELPGGGLRYRWKTPVLDGSNVSLTTTYATLTISVPVGLAVNAFGNVMANTGGFTANVRQPGMSDGTPSMTTSPGSTVGATGTATNISGQWSETTNTSAQIEWASASSVAGNYLVTKGFDWSRR